MIVDLGKASLNSIGDQIIIIFNNGEDSIVVSRSTRMIDVVTQLLDHKQECERMQKEADRT